MAEFKQSDFSGGMASDLNVSLAPPNTVNMLLNMDADVEIGFNRNRTQRRVGTTETAGNNLLDGIVACSWKSIRWCNGS